MDWSRKTTGSRSLRSLLHLAVAAAWAPAPGMAQEEVTPPRVLERADASYPAEELAARREATVELLVTLGSDGSVKAV